MGNEVDRERFPTLHAYLAQLPQGLNSYPEALSKGSLLRSSLEGHDVGRLVDELPDVLRAVIESPPPAGVWVPAVHSDAVFHAVVDRFHPTDERVIAWSEARTLSMAKGPMYGALFRVSARPLSSAVPRDSMVSRSGARRCPRSWMTIALEYT